MKRERIILNRYLFGVLIIFLFIFSFTFSSALSVSTTDINSTYTTVRVTGEDVYGYEINFVQKSGSATAIFAGALGGGTATGTNLKNQIFSVYESKLDSSATGVNLNNNIVFNISHTRDITLRQIIASYADGEEETTDLCDESLACYDWSSCIGGVQTRVCESITCLYDDIVQTQSCGTIGQSTGGGGGSTVKYVQIKLVVPQDVFISDNESIIRVPFAISNNGDSDMTGITLSTQILYNDAVQDSIKTSLSTETIDKLESGKKKDMELTINGITNKSGKYKVTIYVNVTSPAISDWAEFYISFYDAKKVSQVEEVLFYTDDYLSKNKECAEFKEMLKNAKVLAKEGKYQEAEKLIADAEQACKKATKSFKMNLSENLISNVAIYVGVAIILTFVIGLSIYFWRKWFGNRKKRVKN
jgi:hypothetical protein